MFFLNSSSGCHDYFQPTVVHLACYSLFGPYYSTQQYPKPLFQESLHLNQCSVASRLKMCGFSDVLTLLQAVLRVFIPVIQVSIPLQAVIRVSIPLQAIQVQ